MSKLPEDDAITERRRSCWFGLGWVGLGDKEEKEKSFGVERGKGLI